MTEQKTLEAAFNKDRETKRMVRFQESVAGNNLPIIGTLYLSKEALTKIGNPERLVVRVSHS